VPGTRDYICCGYQVLQVTLNCPMDCTYCVLQGYVNVPAITVFVNVEDLLEELETPVAQHPDLVWRLGTGEFGDSLALDGLMGLNELLIPRLLPGAGHPGDQEQVAAARASALSGPQSPGHFRLVPHPAEIIPGEEKFAASLESRLQAAARAVAAGSGWPFTLTPDLFPGLGRGLPAHR